MERLSSEAGGWLQASDGSSITVRVPAEAFERRAMACRALVETRALAVAEERELSSERALLGGTREVGGKPHGYLLLLLRTKRHVFTFEAWGPAELFDAARPALEKSALSLED